MAHEIMNIGCLYDQYMGHDIEIYVHGDPSLSIIRTNKAQLQCLLHSSISFAIQNIFQLYQANPRSFNETQEIVIRLYPSKTISTPTGTSSPFNEKKTLAIEVYDSGLSLFSSGITNNVYKVGPIPQFNRVQGGKQTHSSDGILTPVNVDPNIYHDSARSTNYYFSFHEQVCRDLSHRYGETYELSNVLHYKYTHYHFITM